MQHLAPPASSPGLEPQRSRSQSSASAGGAAQAAAERATQWLSSLAPRGEGRGREFITNTLSGVATVASTVGQEVNGFIAANAAARNGAAGHSRPNSFSASSPPNGTVPVPYARRDSARSPSPSAHTNGGGAGRRIPQPANISRLGGAAQGSALRRSIEALPSPSHQGTARPLPNPALHRRQPIPYLARARAAHGAAARMHTRGRAAPAWPRPPRCRPRARSTRQPQRSGRRACPTRSGSSPAVCATTARQSSRGTARRSRRSATRRRGVSDGDGQSLLICTLTRRCRSGPRV
ncbi:hypothetical protein VHUM_03976 [Vanrija humicola]|uniref:Uncharacterized protein n=1 Tax=Vanrija humicola TaxID=5417 RepID=A0A7D8UX05_VANHU|nr:hypothetical protein VHUM_03976 [Vanrija humicola]